MAGSSVRIRVRVDDDTAGGLAAVRRSIADVSVRANTMFSGMPINAATATGKVYMSMKALNASLGVVAASIPVAFGAAFIGVAAYALRNTEEVSSAFEGLKKSVTQSVTRAAMPIKDELVGGILKLTHELGRLEPAFRAAFSSAGSLIDPFVSGLTSFVENTMPGVNAALKGAKPVVEGFGSALGSVGSGLSNMITRMTSDKEALGVIWVEMGEGLEDVLGAVGDLTEYLIENGKAANSLKQILEGVEAGIYLVKVAFQALEGIEMVFGGPLNKLSGLRQGLEGLSSALSGNFSEAWSIWSGKADQAEKDMEDLEARNKTLLQAGLDAADATMDYANRLEEQARAARGLDDDMQRLIDTHREMADETRSAMDASSSFEEAIDRASQAAIENSGVLDMVNGNLDLNSSKSRDAADALSYLSEKTWANYDAILAQGGSVKEATAIMERGRQQFIANAVQMGLNSAEAKVLADKLFKIPSKRTTKVSLSGAQKAKNDADTIRRKIKNIPNKTAYVNVKLRGTPMALQSYAEAKAYQVRASGGYVGQAAGGGPRSNRVLVGEQGPEIVDLPPGSRVRSNPDSRRIAGSSGDGSSGVTVINLVMDGKTLAQVMVDPLRKEIKNNGGNVQAYLGR